MRFIYYTIYWFYDRVIRVNWYDTPRFYTNIFLALIYNFVIFSFWKIYLLNTVSGHIDYSKWWFFSLGILLYFFNRVYFRSKGDFIVKEISRYPKGKRKIIRTVSFTIIILCAFMYFYTGFLVRNHNFPS
jgi:hypothetical protein